MVPRGDSHSTRIRGQSQWHLLPQPIVAIRYNEVTAEAVTSLITHGLESLEQEYLELE